eukprot:m.233207 g.233207  ORF g.233207 m.233207 type:complete len:265 (+) comp19016_c0_seq1:105-899(+)
MATTINLEFYDGGTDLNGAQGGVAPPPSYPPQYSAPPATPSHGYSSQFVAPTYAAGPTPAAYNKQPSYPQFAQPTAPMGTMDSGNTFSNSLGFDEEPPLLEELGINFQHIFDKTLAVLHPMKPIGPHLMDDTDLAGPLIFCLLFGSFLLATGKVHFGYIYGMGLLSCLGMYAILNLMSEQPLSVVQTASVLGYSLLPMVALSSISILLSLVGIFGSIASIISVLWCTTAAARLFTAALSMRNQRLLVAYPCGIIYSVFALLTIF